jgi:hypothetical protein
MIPSKPKGRQLHTQWNLCIATLWNKDILWYVDTTSHRTVFLRAVYITSWNKDTSKLGTASISIGLHLSFRPTLRDYYVLSNETRSHKSRVRDVGDSCAVVVCHNLAGLAVSVLSAFVFVWLLCCCSPPPTSNPHLLSTIAGLPTSHYTFSHKRNQLHIDTSWPFVWSIRSCQWLLIQVSQCFVSQ